jgi:hypothetical protein
MTTAAIQLNPMQTTVASGTFATSSSGFIVGTALDDPAIRYELAAGVLATTETLPMFGGVGISEAIPRGTYSNTTTDSSLGPTITRATNVTSGSTAGNLTGFSVFDQNFAMINSPQSPVPTSGSGMEVNFYRLGCGMRVALAIDAAFAATLPTLPVTEAVSWDFTAQQIVKEVAAYGPNTITGVSWASTSGGQYTFTYSGSSLGSTLVAGDTIDTSGIVSTFAINPNGAWDVVSANSSTVVVTAAASANAGGYTSGGSILAGGGALGVAGVLEVNLGNSMVPVYNSSTGFVTWNYTGNACVVRL